LARGFRDFGWLLPQAAFRPIAKAEASWQKQHSLDIMMEESCSLHGNQEIEREGNGPGTKYVLQGHAISYLLLPIKVYFLKFSPSLNSTTTYGSSLWGTFQMQAIIITHVLCCVLFPLDALAY
jgi:hypothetical protein